MKNTPLYNKLDFERLKKLSVNFNILSEKYRYSYNFKWLGMRIIKLPSDLLVLQEIISEVRPQYIIETGIAHGGSLIFFSSILKLLNIKNSKVIGVEINLRKKNELLIKRHPLSKNIKIIKGSSTDPIVFKLIKKTIKRKKTIVVLDSNHNEEHVLKELEMYSSLVSKNSYIIVQDTGITHMPESFNKNRPWTQKKNPHSAVFKFLKKNIKFKIMNYWYEKIMFSSSPDGFLKKVK
jgi:cephalosporin hydroxylase